MATGKDRTLVALPNTTLARMEAFRAREWSYIPQETRRQDITHNAVILRLLDIEEHTRPKPERHEKRQPRGVAPS